MKVPPRKYLIRIDDRYLAEFVQYWLAYDKPCNLLWRKVRSEGLTGIRVIIETDEAASFLLRAYQKIGFSFTEESIK